jgi:lipoprotein-anchoring transpeptidase ErfK/SrfK
MTGGIKRWGLAGLCAAALAACSPSDEPAAPAAPAPKAARAATAPIAAAPVAVAVVAPSTPPQTSASTSPVGLAINATVFAPGAKADQQRDQLIKVEVLLDRAHFSPGVIDGRGGGNLKQAIAAYEAAHGLPAEGELNEAVWDLLTAADKGPAVTDYTITADDVKGPFIGKTPTDMKAMAKLDRLDFTGPLQLLAEKFHMDQKLLITLNPNADFGAAGTSIVVTVPNSASLDVKVASVEVDKSLQQVRAFDETGKLAAVYPATVGSQERPAPSGILAVRDVAPSPDYTFDPSRLSFGKSEAKLTIAPGPNNPVGSTWIGLNKATYGIHGTPDPTLVGKIASHGCVRLTNWDARQLGAAVTKGARVAFVGEETHKKTVT